MKTASSQQATITATSSKGKFSRRDFLRAAASALAITGCDMSPPKMTDAELAERDARWAAEDAARRGTSTPTNNAPAAQTAPTVQQPAAPETTAQQTQPASTTPTAEQLRRNAELIAQQQPRLNQQQRATVAQLKEEWLKIAERGGLGENRGCSMINVVGNNPQPFINDRLQNVRPILVGKNVVLCRGWLTPVGSNHFTEAQLQHTLNQLDMVYDSMRELTGNIPQNVGEKLFINVGGGSHNHHGHNSVCIAQAHIHRDEFLRGMQQNNALPFLIPHEMGHSFASAGSAEWVAENETVANWLVAYVTERHNLTITAHGSPSRRGTQYRTTEFNNANQNFRRGVASMPPFARDAVTDGSAYAFIMYGLVNQVGWDVIGRALRSYNDPDFVQTKIASFGPRGITSNNDSSVSLYNLLYRIQHFNGGRNPLSPDAQRVLDHHFGQRLMSGGSTWTVTMIDQTPAQMEQTRARQHEVARQRQETRELIAARTATRMGMTPAEFA